MNRIVVFDMDETLGTFFHLSVFLKALTTLFPYLDYDAEFNKTMNLFSILHRPYIKDILRYVCKARRNGNISRIILYTNNRGDPSWARRITGYFENVLKCKIFDDIIFAYMVNGKIIDGRRTTNDKTITDLRRCSRIANTTQICFIDDQYHEDMNHPNVTYIKVPPYNYSIGYHEMVTLYYSKYPICRNKPEFISNMVHYMNIMTPNVKRTTLKEYRNHISASKQLSEYIKIFCTSS